MALKFFTVKGNGSFPFKLLHVDKCYPASEVDAERITFACATVAPEQRIALASTREPSYALWREAKWPVQSVS